MNIEKELQSEFLEITQSFSSIISQNMIDSLISSSIDILIAIFIFFIGKWLANKGVRLLGTILKKAQVEKTLIKFLQNILYYVLIVVIVLTVLNKMGIQTTSFIAILGAAGLAIGLALKDSLNNFASGVMIILFTPFKVGDSVNAGGVSGTVIEVTIFNTVFLTADNQKIIVPNGSVAKGAITNVNINPTRRVDITLSISYENNIQKVRDVLEKIFVSNDKILSNKPTSISISDLAENSIKISVNVWALSSDFGSVKSKLLEDIKNQFDENGIKFSYKKDAN